MIWRQEMKKPQAGGNDLRKKFQVLEMGAGSGQLGQDIRKDTIIVVIPPMTRFETSFNG